MDSIFHLENGDRAAFLKQMMQAFGCVYICLRCYVPPPYNCLKGLDGIFHETSTSHGSLARRLFHVYRESSTYPDSGLIPGIAFASSNPYMKLQSHEFHGLVSSDFQLQFYQTIVLMGCATGEIELGMSDHNPQVDVETEMKNLIRIHFPHHNDPNQPPSSSSSSLLSLSVDSPEYPPYLFNIPTTTTTAAAAFLPQQTLISSSSIPPHDQTIQILSQFRNAQFPSIESEDAAMTKAILAVLSSPSTSSTSQHKHIPTAFRRYQANLAPRFASTPQNHSRFKRAVSFFRKLSLRSRHEIQGNQPTATQLHHMISERKRREKLNDSFQILRSFLPPGSKKDKASVLSSTTEYLSSLKSQVAELAKRNLLLESQINSIQKSESGTDEAGSSSSGGGRISVEIAQVSLSSSEARFLDLRVRGEYSSLLDLVARLIEFLRGQRSVSLRSVESNTRMLGSVAVHAVIMRLGVEGDDEFDESGFREAVKRVVEDQDN
uniref:Basic helix-loop-helix transcription factor n=1 Tax=Salvia miltiorrhiza TaxID=226208 RepID=A0A0H3YC34_SALMI|nr:basic helix-loop-helix transcription factor [Salvia miltiorrhiza]